MDTEDNNQGTEPTYISGQSVSESGWTTTDVSARALEVSPRTVRRFIDRGELQARKIEKGITEAWEVSIDSLHALRTKREAEGQVRRESAPKSATTDTSTDNMADVLRELTVRLEQRAASEADLRARLELTEEAQSTLRERAEAAEEEAERLRAELEAERSKGFWQRLFGG